MRTNTAPYCPMFDIKTNKPIHGYYAMVAFNHLYKAGTQIAHECDNNRLYAVAATNGKNSYLMLSNLTGETQEINIEGVDLTDARWYILDQERLLSWSAPVKTMANNDVVLVEF